MRTTLLRVCFALLPTLFCLPALQAEVTTDESGRTVLVSRDASGRVQSQTVLDSDGSRHATFTDYWPKSKVAKRTVNEDLDRAGRPTKRTVCHFDNRGRVLERRTVSIDAAGKERGARTRFTYDAQGRGHKTTSPIAR